MRGGTLQTASCGMSRSEGGGGGGGESGVAVTTVSALNNPSSGSGLVDMYSNWWEERVSMSYCTEL